MTKVTIDIHPSHAAYTTTITGSTHIVLADEPADRGGADQGMNPYELLLGSLGSCTSITLRMYAARKGYDLERLRIELQLDKEDGKTIVRRNIYLGTTFSEEVNERLMQVARACPVSRILEGQIEIHSAFV